MAAIGVGGVVTQVGWTAGKEGGWAAWDDVARDLRGRFDATEKEAGAAICMAIQGRAVTYKGCSTGSLLRVTPRAEERMKTPSVMDERPDVRLVGFRPVDKERIGDDDVIAQIVLSRRGGEWVDRNVLVQALQAQFSARIGQASGAIERAASHGVVEVDAIRLRVRCRTLSHPIPPSRMKHRSGPTIAATWPDARAMSYVLDRHRVFVVEELTDDQNDQRSAIRRGQAVMGRCPSCGTLGEMAPRGDWGGALCPEHGRYQMMTALPRGGYDPEDFFALEASGEFWSDAVVDAEWEDVDGSASAAPAASAAPLVIAGREALGGVHARGALPSYDGRSPASPLDDAKTVLDLVSNGYISQKDALTLLQGPASPDPLDVALGHAKRVPACALTEAAVCDAFAQVEKMGQPERPSYVSVIVLPAIRSSILGTRVGETLWKARVTQDPRLPSNLVLFVGGVDQAPVVLELTGAAATANKTTGCR